MRTRYTAEQRERLVAEVRKTGESVRVVAERLGVTASSAHLWMKKASAAPSTPLFARVVRTPTPATQSLTLEVGRSRVRVEAGFDAEFLREGASRPSASALPDASQAAGR
jgi:transposase-like protein